MKCCLCGKEISGSYGNNPYPLCARNDVTSKCCNECNEMVVLARSIFKSSTDDSNIKIGDQIVIMYSENSDEPINMINENKRFLSGIVSDVQKQSENNKLYRGSWGTFLINDLTDQFKKINE